MHLLQQKLKDRYSQAEMGHVEAQKDRSSSLVAGRAGAVEELQRHRSRAGMVYSLPVRDGAFVNAGDLLVQVADLHKVRVRAFIDEPEIGKLQSRANW